MSTKVSQSYTPSFNISITTKAGVITKVTTWKTNVPGSTERTESK